MRPIRLAMSAFGPFADTQVIEFASQALARAEARARAAVEAEAGIRSEKEGREKLRAEREALAYLMLTMHDAGVWVWQIFFTAHLVLLGRLVAHSGMYPRLLGHALTLGGLGYILDSAYSFAFPETHWLGTIRIGLLVLVTAAEIGFALWLLFVGPKGPIEPQ